VKCLNVQIILLLPVRTVQNLTSYYVPRKFCESQCVCRPTFHSNSVSCHLYRNYTKATYIGRAFHVHVGFLSSP
jgi:hypothetical protein